MAVLSNNRPNAGQPPIERIFKLEVPVIVKLAERKMAASEVLKLSVGGIIEFPKSSDEPLVLMINNREIGNGVAVKIGENFGLKVTNIGDIRQIVESMGH